MPSKFSAADLDNAVALYASGKTFTQVSTETGVSVGTIHRAVKARGVEPNHVHRTPAEALERAVTLYVAGSTGPEVQRLSGVPTSVLSRELRKRGIPVRPSKAELPVAQVVSAYLDGESVLSLASRYDVARDTIKRVLVETGTPMRGRSQAQVTRLSKLSSAERSRLSEAAHEAVRGRVVPLDEVVRRAQKREQTLSHASEREFAFGRHLRVSGASVTPQKAIGPYNVDFSIGAVAVEVLGGNWHAYKPEHAQRTPYILNAGWHMLFVWDLKKAPLCVEAAEHVIAWAQQVSGDPSMVRQYRVIRGDGKLLASGCADDQHFPLVPPSIANFGGRPID